MSKKRFGLVGWDEVGFEKKEKKSTGARPKRFITLDQGDNDIRVITDPYEYTFHTFKVEGEKGFGRKIRCSAVTHNTCALCDLDIKTQQRWLIGVIDRKTNTSKVLDMPWTIFKAFKTMNANDRIGDPKLYDVNIVVDKNSPTSYYTVQKYDKEPLSEHDVQLKKDFDLEYILGQCTPLTPEEVQKQMDNAVKYAKVGPVNPHTEEMSKKMEESVNDSSDEDDSEDDEFDFSPAQVG
jgi:hypothetical protein